MGKTHFEQIPLEALKRVAGKKKSAKKQNLPPISSIRQTLDRSERLVQQAKKCIADSKVLQQTYAARRDELRNRLFTKRP